MPWQDGLTGTALEIARTTHTPLRVMAGEYDRTLMY